MTKLSMVPEFSSEGETVTPKKPEQEEERSETKAVDEQSKEAVEAAQPTEEEKETPSEPPAEEKPGDEIPVDTKKPEISDLQNVNQRLSEERVKLLREIAELRGQKREIKQEQLQNVEAAIDELKDVHPDDVVVIEKVLRQKGYIRKDEAQKMWFESVKSEELNRFLNRFPEYKPENDKDDFNWTRLQEELKFYRLPEDPHAVGQVLERAHRAISVSSDRSSVQQKQRQIQSAGAGAGGIQRSSSHSVYTLDPSIEANLHGFSEEEKKKMAERLANR